MSTVMLKNLTNIDRFNQEIEDGWIHYRVHPTNPNLVICCYSQATQMAGHWVADTTMLARGLILKTTSGRIDNDTVIVARGIKKFFTIEHAANDWGHIVLVDDDENVEVETEPYIPMNAPASVSDKLDGALNVAYVYDNEYHIATKGSFTSDEALIGERLLQKPISESMTRAEYLMLNMSFDNAYEDFTPLFEVITPEIHHVLDYENTEELVFLGLVHIESGRWIPAARLSTDPLTCNKFIAHFNSDGVFASPELMTYSTLAEALDAPERDNREGMVVTSYDGDIQTMYKIKYPTFLKMQAVRHMRKAGKQAIVNAIPTELLFDGDVITCIEAAVHTLMPDASSRWGNDIAKLISQTINEEYVMPLRAAYHSFMSLVNENTWKEYMPFDKNGRKEYALYLLKAEENGDIDGFTKALLFCVPKAVDENGALNIHKLQSYVRPILAHNLNSILGGDD